MNLLIIRSGLTNNQEYNENHRKKIKEIVKNIRITLVDPTKEQVNKFIKDTEVVIAPKKDLTNFLDLSKAIKLKWFHTTSAGVDSLIPIFKDLNIIFTNSSGVSPIPIAEHVFSYILMFSRQLITSYKYQKQKRWVSTTPSEIYNKTIGIVGFGRVGKRIAQVAKAFGMNIIVSSFSKTSNVSYVKTEKNIRKLLKQSDYVVNCLPLTNITNNYFSMVEFKLMKKTAYFINIGIGKTINENDLIDALEKKIIAGAALDVFQNEPLPKENKLWDFDNVIITAHYAGKTPLYTDRVIDIFCQNLKMYLNNKTLPNTINIIRGY